MVVQWEDRFMGSNRAHTYLGPIDHEEASGIGVTEKHAMVTERYPDFVGHRQRLWLRCSDRQQEVRPTRCARRDDQLQGSHTFWTFVCLIKSTFYQ